MIHALIVLLLVAGLRQSATTFIALSFGFLLLGALFRGKVCAALRLPRLTGYIIAGVLAGPSVAGLVSHGMLRALGPVQGDAAAVPEGRTGQ